MSIAIPNVLLPLHINLCNRAGLELVMFVSVCNIAMHSSATKVRDQTLIEEMSDLFAGLAMVKPLLLSQHSAVSIMI